MRCILVCFAILFLPLLGACEGEKEEAPVSPPVEATPTPAPSPTPEPTPSPKPEPREGDLGDGLTYRIEEFGNGEMIGDNGTALLNLQVMDDLENPIWEGRFSLRLGVGQAIPGLDRAIVGMKVGETRRISIPWQHGYGEMGDPDVGVAPRQDLLAVVELLEIEDK